MGGQGETHRKVGEFELVAERKGGEERVKDRGGVIESNVQKAQWDTWSWCHSSAKLGLISPQAKLVFIASLGG